MTVRVLCGANAQNVDMSGKSVADVRGFMQQTLNIPAGAEALVTGRRVGDDYVLQENEQLEFVRESGRKG